MAKLSVRPLTRVIGAEVSGVDLAEPLPDAARDEILRALQKHLVLFFRDQALTPEQQLSFALRFGEISPAPFGPKDTRNTEITVLDQISPKGEGADSWHADNTFMVNPPSASILRAVRVPAVGGDTCWADTSAAYEALSEPIRTMIDGMYAVHDITRMLAKAIELGRSDADMGQMQDRFPPVHHPVVRTDPETGRKGLFVNRNWTTRIDGLAQRESDDLLRLLCEQVQSPDCQCRFRWEPGAVAFWDNRFAQHYAVPDYTERRVMWRVTLAGDIPR